MLIAEPFNSKLRTEAGHGQETLVPTLQQEP